MKISLTNSLEGLEVRLPHSSLKMWIPRYSTRGFLHIIAVIWNNTQNISDIAELGLDNPEIYENLLNALEEMGGGDEDSEVFFLAVS